MRKPGVPALLSAVEWLGTYEPAEGGDKMASDLAEVSEWLRVVIERIKRDTFVSRAIRETGCTRVMAMRAWKRIARDAEGEL